MLPQCDVCAVLLQVLCCCSSLKLASETRGAVAGGAVGAVPGPIGSSNIWRRSAGIGRGAVDGVGGATTGTGAGGAGGGAGGETTGAGGAGDGVGGVLYAGVAEFSGVGLDTLEEQEER